MIVLEIRKDRSVSIRRIGRSFDGEGEKGWVTVEY